MKLTTQLVKQVLKFHPDGDLVKGINGNPWGCCGANLGYSTNLPIGIEAFASTAQIETSDKVPVENNERFGMSTASVDIVAGNYLNIRMIHCLHPDKADRSPLIYGGRRLPPFPPIEDGPPLYTPVFSTLMNSLTGGFRPDDNWGVWIKTTSEMREEFYQLAGALTGFNVSFVVRDMPADGLDQAVSFRAFMSKIGWDKHVVYESPLFNNRMHNRPVDTLRLFVIQKG